jgi:hypothetical protein
MPLGNQEDKTSLLQAEMVKPARRKVALKDIDSIELLKKLRQSLAERLDRYLDAETNYTTLFNDTNKERAVVLQAIKSHPPVSFWSSIKTHKKTFKQLKQAQKQLEVDSLYLQSDGIFENMASKMKKCTLAIAAVDARIAQLTIPEAKSSSDTTSTPP